MAEVLDEGHDSDVATLARAGLPKSDALAGGAAGAAQHGHKGFCSKNRLGFFAFAASRNDNQAWKRQVAKHGRAVAAVEQYKRHRRPARAQQRSQSRGAQARPAAAELQQRRRVIVARRVAVAAKRHEQQLRAVQQRQRRQDNNQLVGRLNAAQYDCVQVLGLVKYLWVLQQLLEQVTIAMKRIVDRCCSLLWRLRQEEEKKKKKERKRKRKERKKERKRNE